MCARQLCVRQFHRFSGSSFAGPFSSHFFAYRHLIGELAVIFSLLYLQDSFRIVVVLDYVWLLRCGTTPMASSLCSREIGTSHSLSLSRSWSLANVPAYRVSCSFSLTLPLQTPLRIFSFSLLLFPTCPFILLP